MSGSDCDPTENPTSQPQPDQVASPDQAVPPLPDVEPVRPTYAERRQNYHFETLSRARNGRMWIIGLDGKGEEVLIFGLPIG